MQQRIGNVRWGIAGLLGTGIVINYLDRVNISVATQPFEHEFHLSAGEMGIILSAYLWSYVLLQVPVGALLDRFGVKWLVRIGTFFWAVATYMTAIVSGLGLVLLSRILLGAAEAPIFPGAAKATGYWFPIKERGLATSAFDAAAKFSNVIGIPLVAAAVTIWGWRAGFYIPTGGSDFRQSTGKLRLLTPATESLGLDAGVCSLWLLVLPVLIVDTRVPPDGVAYDRLEEWFLYDCSLGGGHNNRYRDRWLVSRYLNQAGIRRDQGAQDALYRWPDIGDCGDRCSIYHQCKHRDPLDLHCAWRTRIRGPHWLEHSRVDRPERNRRGSRQHHELFQQPGGDCRANCGRVHLSEHWLICREFLSGRCHSCARHRLLSPLARTNRADSKARNRSGGGTGCKVLASTYTNSKYRADVSVGTYEK